MPGLRRRSSEASEPPVEFRGSTLSGGHTEELCTASGHVDHVTIARGPDVVHWGWSAEVPMSCGVSFPAERYDAEVARIAADHTWETPARTAGRLILTGIDHQRLHAHGLKLTWADNDSHDPARFQIASQIDDDYQVFLSLPWHGEDPHH